MFWWEKLFGFYGEVCVESHEIHPFSWYGNLVEGNLVESCWLFLDSHPMFSYTVDLKCCRNLFNSIFLLRQEIVTDHNRLSNTWASSKNLSRANGMFVGILIVSVLVVKKVFAIVRVFRLPCEYIIHVGISRPVPWMVLVWEMYGIYNMYIYISVQVSRK